MFQTVLLSIIRSFSLYTQQWYMSYRLCWLLASRNGTDFRPDGFPSRSRSQAVWHIPLQWYMSYGYADCLQAGTGQSSVLILLASCMTYTIAMVCHICHTGYADCLRAGTGQSSVLILLTSCMTYTIAVCTVKNSRWWTEELSETCRVLFQK